MLHSPGEFRITGIIDGILLANEKLREVTNSLQFIVTSNLVNLHFDSRIEVITVTLITLEKRFRNKTGG